MKAIILVFVLLQLSLITPNPDTKMKAKQKVSKVMRKRNLDDDKQKMVLFDIIKVTWKTGKSYINEFRGKVKKILTL